MRVYRMLASNTLGLVSQGSTTCSNTLGVD